MKIIFLDVDGVLNSLKWFKYLKKHHLPRIDHNMLLQDKSIKLLAKLCKKTGADIVLSSTWRVDKEATDNVAKQLAKCGLYIIDSTPVYSGNRGEEIAKWLVDFVATTRPKPDDRFGKEPAIEKICIIDDDMDMGYLLPSLVKTSWKRGFTYKDYRKAYKLLRDK